MTYRLRPTPDEERWLALAAKLGADLQNAVSVERTGGWRSTGLLARAALFALGLVAGALLVGLLGFGNEITLLIAGLLAALAAEWLIVTRRLFASGIEEGLCVAGYLLVAWWLTTLILPVTGAGAERHVALLLIAAAGAAGLRLLNPLVTTCAVYAFVHWVGSTAVARALDEAIGGNMAMFVVACALAALALVLGARPYRRPSHDRMLDWLVVAMPLAACAQSANWNAYTLMNAAGPGPGSSRLPTVLLFVALGSAMLFTGLRQRRHAPLLGAMVCIAGLAIELRFAAPAIATELWLIGCGIAALFVGVALDRYLREPRNGFTSKPLSSREGPLELLQTFGAAALAQRSTSDLPPSDPAMTGSGGRFGGGGASGSF
jgi:hypothetical protein